MKTVDQTVRQRATCDRAGVVPEFLAPGDRVAIARDFTPINLPINGLRHPRHGDMCGWYIWSGQTLSEDPDLFDVVCYEHVVTSDASWTDYLALPVGWRFLAAPGYDDTWFDESLLQI